MKYKDHFQKKPIIIQILNNTYDKKQTQPRWTEASVASSKYQTSPDEKTLFLSPNGWTNPLSTETAMHSETQYCVLQTNIEQTKTYGTKYKNSNVLRNSQELDNPKGFKPHKSSRQSTFKFKSTRKLLITADVKLGIYYYC